MDLRQAMKWRPDNAYRAARCRPAVATPRSSGSPQPMQIDWPRSGQIYRALLTGQRPDRLSDHAHESDFGSGLSEHRFVSVTCEVW